MAATATPTCSASQAQAATSLSEAILGDEGVICKQIKEVQEEIHSLFWHDQSPEVDKDIQTRLNRLEHLQETLRHFQTKAASRAAGPKHEQIIKIDVLRENLASAADKVNAGLPALTEKKDSLEAQRRGLASGESFAEALGLGKPIEAAREKLAEQQQCLKILSSAVESVDDALTGPLAAQVSIIRNLKREVKDRTDAVTMPYNDVSDLKVRVDELTFATKALVDAEEKLKSLSDLIFSRYGSLLQPPMESAPEKKKKPATPTKDQKQTAGKQSDSPKPKTLDRRSVTPPKPSPGATPAMPDLLESQAKDLLRTTEAGGSAQTEPEGAESGSKPPSPSGRKTPSPPPKSSPTLPKPTPVASANTRTTSEPQDSEKPKGGSPGDRPISESAEDSVAKPVRLKIEPSSSFACGPFPFMAACGAGSPGAPNFSGKVEGDLRYSYRVEEHKKEIIVTLNSDYFVSGLRSPNDYLTATSSSKQLHLRCT